MKYLFAKGAKEAKEQAQIASHYHFWILAQLIPLDNSVTQSQIFFIPKWKVLYLVSNDNYTTVKKMTCWNSPRVSFNIRTLRTFLNEHQKCTFYKYILCICIGLIYVNTYCSNPHFYLDCLYFCYGFKTDYHDLGGGTGKANHNSFLGRLITKLTLGILQLCIIPC